MFSISKKLGHRSCGSGFDTCNDLGQAVCASCASVTKHFNLESKWRVLWWTGPLSRTLGFIHYRLKGWREGNECLPYTPHGIWQSWALLYWCKWKTRWSMPNLHSTYGKLMSIKLMKKVLSLLQVPDFYQSIGCGTNDDVLNRNIPLNIITISIWS